MLMSIIEYKHSYLNIIVAVVFVLWIYNINFKILIGVDKIWCFLIIKIKYLQHGKKSFMEIYYKQCWHDIMKMIKYNIKFIINGVKMEKELVVEVVDFGVESVIIDCL